MIPAREMRATSSFSKTTIEGLPANLPPRNPQGCRGYIMLASTPSTNQFDYSLLQTFFALCMDRTEFDWPATGVSGSKRLSRRFLFVLGQRLPYKGQNDAE
jgi:hypothetical protein